MMRRLVPGRLVLATHNPGKVREIGALLVPYGMDVVAVGDLGLPEPAETEDSFAGNALIKARAAAAGSGLVALADEFTSSSFLSPKEVSEMSSLLLLNQTSSPVFLLLSNCSMLKNNFPELFCLNVYCFRLMSSE